MAFTLPALPYAQNALEPSIDAQTMGIHHGKHHAAYIAKLNAALEGHADLASHSIDDLCRGIADLPEAIRGAVRNNGGGHFNHSLFWQILAPAGNGGAPSSELAAAIDARVFHEATQKDEGTALRVSRILTHCLPPLCDYLPCTTALLVTFTGVLPTSTNTSQVHYSA